MIRKNTDKVTLITSAIVEDSYGTYKAEQNEKWQPMVTFDCRGVEPCDFDPRVSDKTDKIGD